MLEFLFVLLLFSIGFTLSLGLISYVIFRWSGILVIGVLLSASIFGLILLIAAIEVIISYIECFIDDHLRK